MVFLVLQSLDGLNQFLDVGPVFEQRGGFVVLLEGKDGHDDGLKEDHQLRADKGKRFARFQHHYRHRRKLQFHDLLGDASEKLGFALGRDVGGEHC